MIQDFTAGEDHISLSGIDADTGLAGNQAFSFIGDAAFSHVAGELRVFSSGGATVAAGDVDGDGVADVEVALTGTHDLSGGVFVL